MKSKLFTYGTFLLCLLGMLSAFGPFVTDMYLPALPQLQTYFSTDASTVQLSLSASMYGLALGQLFFGPLSDKYGRKPVIIVSLWVFILSTVACLFSTGIEMFVGLRLLQGIGGAGGIVLSRSIATDRYWGEKLAKMMAVIGAIQGIAPVSAPIIGGMMTDSLGWRGIFTLLLLLGVLLLLGSLMMRETLPAGKRTADGIVRTFASIGAVLRNRKFLSLLLQYGCCGGAFFAYIASSPFIIQQHYGFSAFGFSLIFAVNALVLGIGAGASMKFKTPRQSTFVGSVGLLAFSVALLLAMLLGATFWLYECLVLAMLACIGTCFSSSVALAMNEAHERAGAASALVGAIIFVLGGVVSPLVGMGDIVVSTSLIFVVCGVLALGFCLRFMQLDDKTCQ